MSVEVPMRDGSGGPKPRPGVRQIIDVRASIHDPTMDWLLPSGLTIEEWLSDSLPMAWLHALVTQHAWELTQFAVDANRGLRDAARQKGPHLPKSIEDAVRAAKRNLEKGVLPSILDKGQPTQASVRVGGKRSLETDFADKFFPTAAPSAKLFLALRDRWLDSDPREGCDLRRDADWFHVGDQGRTASCVGHAIADLIERQRGLRNDPPSARFIWQAAKEDDGDPRPTTMFALAGTSVRAGLAVVTRFGYPTESEFPTWGNGLYEEDMTVFYARTKERRSSRIVNLGRGTKSWASWLAAGRPIVASLMVGSQFFAPKKDRVQPDPRGKDSFGHSVLLMGYRLDQDRIKADGVPESVDSVRELLGHYAAKNALDEDLPFQYLVRNSAGTRWGDRGYAWMSQADLCAQAGEAYGLLWNDDLEALGLDQEHQYNHEDASREATAF